MCEEKMVELQLDTANATVKIEVPASCWDMAQEIRRMWCRTTRFRRPMGSESPQAILLVLEYVEYVLHRTAALQKQGVQCVGTLRDIAAAVLFYIDRTYLDQQGEIHGALQRISIASEERRWALRCYFAALKFVSHTQTRKSESLFEKGLLGQARITVVFGTSYHANILEDLRSMINVYRPLIYKFAKVLMEHLNDCIRPDPTSDIPQLSTKVLGSLDQHEAGAELSELLSRPSIAVPLAGLVQLLNYYLVVHLSGVSIEQARRSLHSIGGCFEGSIIAAAVAAASSKDDFLTLAKAAITVLTTGGIYSEKTFPLEPLKPSIVKDCTDSQLDLPTRKLVLKGIPPNTVQNHVETINSFLPQYQKVDYSAQDELGIVVATGQASTLHGLRSRILADSSCRSPETQLIFLPTIFHGKNAWQKTAESISATNHDGQRFAETLLNSSPAKMREVWIERLDPTVAGDRSASTHVLDFSLGDLGTFAASNVLVRPLDKVQRIAGSKFADATQGFTPREDTFCLQTLTSTNVTLQVRRVLELGLPAPLKDRDVSLFEAVDCSTLRHQAWIRALLFTAESIQCGEVSVRNPFREIVRRENVLIVVDGEAKTREFVLYESSSWEGYDWEPCFKATVYNEDLIDVLLPTHDARALWHLTWTYSFKVRPEPEGAELCELSESSMPRLKSYIRHLWTQGEAAEVHNTSLYDANTQDGGPMYEQEWVLSLDDELDELQDLPWTTRALYVCWKSLTAPLVSSPDIDINLPLLRCKSLAFETLSSNTQLAVKGAPTSCKSKVKAVTVADEGKVFEVEALMRRDSTPTLKIVAHFLIPGDFDSRGTFSLSAQDRATLLLETQKDVAVLVSRDWVEFLDKRSDLIGTTVHFNISSTLREQEKDIWASLTVQGDGEVTRDGHHVCRATVDYAAWDVEKNPVLDFLQRHDRSGNKPAPIGNPTIKSFEAGCPLYLQQMSEGLATLQRAFSKPSASLWHLLGSSDLAVLPDIVARVHDSVAKSFADGNAARVVRISTKIQGKVARLTNKLRGDVTHWGMREGRLCIRGQSEASTSADDRLLVEFEAEIEEKPTVYLFTGQGSQRQNMGMELMSSSKAARSVWTRADKYLLENYGFEITTIVKQNPKQLEIHFGGARGARLRENYLSLTADGTADGPKLFPRLEPDSESLRFQSEDGLLSVTGFAQIGLTLNACASVEDMRARHLLSGSSVFAGHSLGEFAAIAAMTGFVSVEELVKFVLIRGFSADMAVERDQHGQSVYRMCAVNPSAIHPEVSDEALGVLVRAISERTASLLEVVNLNERTRQHVCAGEKRAIVCLVEACEMLRARSQEHGFFCRAEPLAAPELSMKTTELVREAVEESLKRPWTAFRTPSVTLLRGIDVPFHSSALMPAVGYYRQVCRVMLEQSRLNPDQLLSKYVPNLVAEPFSLRKDYFQLVYDATESPVLADILDKWDSFF